MAYPVTVVRARSPWVGGPVPARVVGSFSLAPDVATATIPVVVTATGYGTTWGAATRFSAVLGGVAAPRVLSPTSATFVYVPPASPGVDDLTDGSMTYSIEVEPAPATPTPGVRDRTILRGIKDLLLGSLAFHDVTTGGLPAAAGGSAEVLKLASLELSDFNEATFDGGTYDQVQLRDVRFTLTVSVRDPDPDSRDDEADRLSCVALNAVNGVSVLGATVADRTRLARGVYLPATTSERQVKLLGTFSYLVDGYQAHFTTP